MPPFLFPGRGSIEFLTLLSSVSFWVSLYFSGPVLYAHPWTDFLFPLVKPRKIGLIMLSGRLRDGSRTGMRVAGESPQTLGRQALGS